VILFDSWGERNKYCLRGGGGGNVSYNHAKGRTFEKRKKDIFYGQLKQTQKKKREELNN